MSDVTGWPALDLAIGLSFIFLILSLLATAVQEGIAGIVALRARVLFRGVRNMLDGNDKLASSRTKPLGPGESKALSRRLYDHPLIRSLYKTGRGGILRGLAIDNRRPPSYIPPRAFALALLDTVAPDAALRSDSTRRAPHDVVAYVTKTVKTDTHLNNETKKALLTLLKDSRGDIDALHRNVELWFDDSMARVSGWYKRTSQLMLMAIAVPLVLALNANALTIGEQLLNDPAVRAAVVEQAIEEAEHESAPAIETPEQAQKRIKVAYDREPELAAVGLPLGWTTDAGDPRFVGWEWGLLYHDLAGWLLTIMAISLGAPFWFDTLSRFSRLRSSGKPEQPLPASAFGHKNERVSST